MIGGGGHAKVVLSTLLRLNNWNIVGYIDKKKRDINSVEYLGDDDKLKDLINTVKCAVIGIGQIKDHNLRYKLYVQIKELGFYLPYIIAKSATIMSNISIGEGSYIGERAYIGPDVKIGKMCIINTGSIVEHGSEVGAFVHVSLNSSLGGNVRLGSETFVGMGSNILNDVTVGENVIVAAGAVVRKNIENNSLIYGNPGRVKRDYNKKRYV